MARASARQRAAVLAGKAVRWATRATGRGGTALPGLIAERIDPCAVQGLAAGLDGATLVTGTNGKTTTAAMLAAMLRAAGHPVVHNRAGSNLMRGIASALLDAAGTDGAVPRGALGVFETDEATLPQAARAVPARALVITNLMRDQLDRYGEIEAIRNRWLACIRELPETTTLVLNADDPLVATLGGMARGPLRYFGIEDAAVALDPVAAATEMSDAIWDPESGDDFLYERRFYGHLGHWHTAHGAGRPLPLMQARAIRETPAGIQFQLQDGPETVAVRLPLQGLYSVSNALAASAAAGVLGVDLGTRAEVLGRYRAAFGRQEALEVGGHPVRLLLGKNPAGLNQALGTLCRDAQRHDLLILLNDGLADGTDVSWIWDTDWERIAPHAASVVVGGRRAADMTLRLRYAGLPEPRACHNDIGDALRAALGGLPGGGVLVVLPTYTALLDVRERLGRMGAAPLWEGA